MTFYPHREAWLAFYFSSTNQKRSLSGDAGTSFPSLCGKSNLLSLSGRDGQMWPQLSLYEEKKLSLPLIQFVTVTWALLPQQTFPE